MSYHCSNCDEIVADAEPHPCGIRFISEKDPPDTSLLDHLLEEEINRAVGICADELCGSAALEGPFKYCADHNAPE